VHGYMLLNPATGMKMKRIKRNDQAREQFNTQDIQKLFNKERCDSFNKPYQLWTPLIALYTGARMNEICQLHLDDIKETESIYYIDINEKPLIKSSRT